MESDVQNLLSRIDEEFARSKKKIEQLRKEKVEEHQGRQSRLQLFEKACERLKGVWGPRLQALSKAFGERVKVEPHADTGRRQANFAFVSNLARINLTFTATTDAEVRNLVLEYNLQILPVLMTYPDRARLEQPLDRIDEKAIGEWIDERIVEFVKTYLSVHDNEFYLKAHMVEDPVAHVRFPEFAAASTLERGGKTLYFIANETREEFEAKERKQKSAG
jgi:YHS domain-containing protein